MYPQIFVSSTFYDLKYVREALRSFISNYGFTPILSENGDIGYTPGRELDQSCYETMKQSDMAILIVGGRYGSPASGESKTDYFSEYTSITRKEFNTAVDNSIPVFVFIEEPVYSEYQTYAQNRSYFEGKPDANFKFAHVDNINVYRFVESILSVKKLTITSFRNVEDIKSFLRKQWASMLQEYLGVLRHSSLIDNLQTPINMIFSRIEQMNNVLSVMSGKLITDDEDIKRIGSEQEVEHTAEQIANSFEFICLPLTDEEIRQFISFFLDKLTEARNKDLLENVFSDNPADVLMFYSLFEYDGVMLVNVKKHIKYSNCIDSIDQNKEELITALCKEPYLLQMGFSKK